MKKLFSYISLIALCAMAAVSCKKDVDPPITNEYVTLTSASAVYHGDSKETGTGFFALTLNGENTLYLELFGDLASDGVAPALKAGEYKVGTGNALTFIAGEGETGSTYSGKAITGGTFSIASSGTSYTVTTTLTDADGNAVKCKYEGAINITDESEDKGDEFVTITEAIAVYWGDSEDTGTGFFELGLSAGNETNGQSLYLQFFGDLKGDAAPVFKTGKYTIGTGNALTFIVGNDLADDGSLYSVFTDGTETIKSITGGSFTIDLSGTTYSITTDLIDSDGNAIKCKYEGAIEISDESESDSGMVFSEAGGTYYGDKAGYGNGTGYFYIQFAYEENGVTYLLTLDAISEMAEDTANATLQPGEYIGNESLETGTFKIGTFNETSGRYYGSVFSVIDEAGITTYGIVGGSFEILSVEDGVYDIAFDLIQHDEATLKATFKGAIPCSDESADGGGSEDGTLIDMDGALTEVLVIPFGSDDVSNLWGLMMLVNEEEYVMLSVSTPLDVTELAGEYSFDTVPGEGFALIPGDDMENGSFYKKVDSSNGYEEIVGYVPFTSGSLSIQAIPFPTGFYGVAFEFQDADTAYTVKGTYMGLLTLLE